MRTRLAKRSLLLAVFLLGLSSVIPAFAQEDGGRKADTTKVETTAGGDQTVKPSVITYAWFWKDQQQHKVTNPADGTDVATLELKNPYCPDTAPAGSPPEQVCKPGRLPVEVRNNYEEPDKLSAINFDLSAAVPGSKVKKFTVRLWEAQDEFSRSTQYNLDGKQIQACVIDDVFGEGEARLYKEVPRFKCSKTSAVAKRESTTIGKGTDEKEVFYWDLDLTEQAQQWVKDEVFFTSVMLMPKAPKEPTPQENAWQVVFAGPLETKFGIDNVLVIDPPKIEKVVPPPPPPPPGGDSDPLTVDDPGTSLGSSSPTTTTTTTGTGSPTSTSAPTGDAPAGDAGAEPATEEPTAAEDAELASDEAETSPSGMPLYMWLAILAGMLGFTMVRSVVLEKNTGVRPDGVLAQIQKLNAQRRGTAVAGAESSASPFAGLMAGLGAIGTKVTSGAGKLAQLVSRKKG